MHSRQAASYPDLICEVDLYIVCFFLFKTSVEADQPGVSTLCVQALRCCFLCLSFCFLSTYILLILQTLECKIGATYATYTTFLMQLGPTWYPWCIWPRNFQGSLIHSLWPVFGTREITLVRHQCIRSQRQIKRKEIMQHDVKGLEAEAGNDSMKQGCYISCRHRTKLFLIIENFLFHYGNLSKRWKNKTKMTSYTYKMIRRRSFLLMNWNTTWRNLRTGLQILEAQSHKAQGKDLSSGFSN